MPRGHRGGTLPLILGEVGQLPRLRCLKKNLPDSGPRELSNTVHVRAINKHVQSNLLPRVRLVVQVLGRHQKVAGSKPTLPLRCFCWVPKQASKPYSNSAAVYNCAARSAVFSVSFDVFIESYFLSARQRFLSGCFGQLTRSSVVCF